MIKAFFYIFFQDKKLFFKIFLSSPFKYLLNILKASFKKPYTYSNGLFFFNVEEKNFKKEDSTTFTGFSYCQKPIDCPCKRFSENCLYLKNNFTCKNNICKNCFISSFEKRENIFFITTVSSLSKKIFQTLKKHPKNKNIFFIISACFFSIDLFKHFPNILNIKAIAIPLSGNVCSNFEKFKKAEIGKKKGKTEILKKNFEFLKKILT